MASVTEHRPDGPTGKFPKNFAMILIGAVAGSLALGMYISEGLSTADKAKQTEDAEKNKRLEEDRTKLDIQAEIEAQAREALERRKAEEEAARLAAMNKPPIEEVLATGKGSKGDPVEAPHPPENNYDPAADKELVLREQAAQSPLLAIQKGSLSGLGSGGGKDDMDPVIKEALDLARESVKGGSSGTGAMSLGTPPARQDPNDTWLKTVAANQHNPSDYVTIRDPLLDRPVLHEGSVIPIVLQNGLNSQLPGMVIGTATRDIYDSVTGRVLVIPKGTKFIGRYNSQVRQGQNRLMFAFHRLIFPDGRDANLRGMEGGDQLAYTGVDGDVNTHFLEMFSSGLLIALMSVGVDNLSNRDTNVTVIGGGSGGAGAASGAAGQVMVETAKESLKRFEGMPPTITIEPGTPLNVLVNKDIVL